MDQFNLYAYALRLAHIYYVRACDAAALPNARVKEHCALICQPFPARDHHTHIYRFHHSQVIHLHENTSPPPPNQCALSLSPHRLNALSYSVVTSAISRYSERCAFASRVPALPAAAIKPIWPGPVLRYRRVVREIVEIFPRRLCARSLNIANVSTTTQQNGTSYSGTRTRIHKTSKQKALITPSYTHTHTYALYGKYMCAPVVPYTCTDCCPLH